MGAQAMASATCAIAALLIFDVESRHATIAM